MLAPLQRSLAVSEKLAFADMLVLACIAILIFGLHRFFEDTKDRRNRGK